MEVITVNAVFQGTYLIDSKDRRYQGSHNIISYMSHTNYYFSHVGLAQETCTVTLEDLWQYSGVYQI